MGTAPITAAASSDGLSLNGHSLDCKLPPGVYWGILGPPTRTFEPSPPAPYGHRNNQIHIYDSEGIYLTEHHASRLIDSINFIFDPSDSPFPIECSYRGSLVIDGQLFSIDMPEKTIVINGLSQDLRGAYRIKFQNCSVWISTKGRRGADRKRKKPRYVVCVSVCF